VPGVQGIYSVLMKRQIEDTDLKRIYRFCAIAVFARIITNTEVHNLLLIFCVTLIVCPDLLFFIVVFSNAGDE
jgi:hypothetical protein